MASSPSHSWSGFCHFFTFMSYTAHQPHWQHFCGSNKLMFISKWHVRPLVITIKKAWDSLPQNLLLRALLFYREPSETDPADRNISACVVKAQPPRSPFAFSHTDLFPSRHFLLSENISFIYLFTSILLV